RFRQDFTTQSCFNLGFRVKFIYYSALEDGTVCESNGKLRNNDRVPSPGRGYDGYKGVFPWDMKQLASAVKIKKGAAIKGQEKAESAQLLEDKLDLGPFKLGISKKDLPAGGTTRPSSIESSAFIPNNDGYTYLEEEIEYGKIVYAGLETSRVLLTFKEDILTSIEFKFSGAQDVSALRSALIERFGEPFSSQGNGASSSTEWKSKSNRLGLGEFEPESVRAATALSNLLGENPNRTKRDLGPSLSLRTTRFDDRIKALGNERKIKAQNELKAKAAKMADQL
ncbi:MAG: hypothetical protein WCG03_10990, partial [Kiritimatiellales bacterium]